MDLLAKLDLMLFEDVESRISYLIEILLGKKSRWKFKELPDAQERAVKLIHDIAPYDPTGERYLQFIVKQVANGTIRFPEDGPPLKEALEIFSKAFKKKEWSGHRDITKYDNWRDLQSHTMAYAATAESKTTPASETEWVKKAKEGSNKIVDFNFNGIHVDENNQKISKTFNFVVIELITPVAVTVYGRGTQWCTSCSLFKTVKPNEVDSVVSQMNRERTEGDPWADMSPEAMKKYIMDINGGNLDKDQIKVPNPYYVNALQNAKHYLSGGPMYIVFKDKEPYAQITNNGRELRNATDRSLFKASPMLALVFEEMVKSNKISPDMRNVLNGHIERSGLKNVKRN